MKNKSPQTTSSTPPAPNAEAPAAAGKQRSRADQDARKIGDDLEDAAKKTLRQEIAEKIPPQSKAPS